MLLLLFLGGVFVRTAAETALSPAEALETMQEFAAADTNGDGFLVPDEVMALDEVRSRQRQRSSPGSLGQGQGQGGRVRVGVP